MILSVDGINKLDSQKRKTSPTDSVSTKGNIIPFGEAEQHPCQRGNKLASEAGTRAEAVERVRGSSKGERTQVLICWSHRRTILLQRGQA